MPKPESPLSFIISIPLLAVLLEGAETDGVAEASKVPCITKFVDGIVLPPMPILPVVALIVRVLTVHGVQNDMSAVE